MVSYLLHDKGNQYRLIGVICAFVLFLTVFLWGVMEIKEKVSTYDCLDIYAMKTMNPNNFFLFVADEKAKELGCKYD